MVEINAIATMYTRILVPAAIAASLLLTTAPVHAAKGNKGAGGGRAGEGRFFNRFDTNHDGTLESSEAEGVRNAFTALKSLDTNGDGQLSDSEISAAKLAQGKGGKGGKRGKKKNNA